MKEMNIVIIGLGGIGSILVDRISKFINYSRDIRAKFLLVDGDSYEDKNYERQEFSFLGNKAEVKQKDLQMTYSRLDVRSFDSFVDTTNIKEIINDGDVVFMCVDNHKSRMIVSNHCKSLSNIILISGGNDYTDGNVQIYIRKDNKDITPDLCRYHPEIAKPDDKMPHEMSCQELAMSEPQLYFANLGAATIMCWAFYNVVVKEVYDRSEIYFDILTMNSNSKIRSLN
jgi:molybdopterin/thiamine biosynthesis adenylyltransferase